MSASVFDSPLYAHLFPTGDTGRLFSDSAAIRAMLLVEGALAKVQGRLGVIPEVSGAAIHRASLEVLVDPGALAKSTGANGVCVPGLVAAFRTEMQAPEHAQYVHWGATSQDIIDTALMLRLRQGLSLAETDLRRILAALAHAAEAHAETPCPARTYAQHATPTSWGAVLAGWGHPLLDALEALPGLRNSALWVSLSGAAGTSAALGPLAAETRAALAEALGLGDPKRSWHVDRGPVTRIADWMAQVTAPLGAMGQSLIALSATGIAEASFGAVGASSTMPQKTNPVGPSVLAALAAQMGGLRAGLQASASHQHQRDGVAWFAEWMILPQVCLTAASALQSAASITEQMTPDTDAMRAALSVDGGLIHAEALSFALASRMSRTDAQAATKRCIAESKAQGVTLREAAHAAYPDLPEALFDPAQQMGQAPSDARAFAARVKAL
jgi:3-carboxy-cis,cis-muconate cycloisomerase